MTSRPPTQLHPTALSRRADGFSTLLQVIGRALTHYPNVVTVNPRTPARDAIRLLRRHHFSQVPVVDRGQVSGLFSYRSFALAVADVFDLPGGHRADGLSVWECLETPTYVQGSDDFQRLFDELNRRDAVLVGSPGQCEGIITAMGVMRYLYDAASPFLLVAEIELALRAIIQLSVQEDEVRRIASASLSHYTPDRVPARLEDMTFTDYVLLVGHGENWDRFDRLFQADRARTSARLRQVRDLRNDVFHFRRELGPQDIDMLTASRDWMLRLVGTARETQEFA